MSPTTAQPKLMLTLILLPCTLCAALRTPATRTPPPRMMATAGELLRVAHTVADVDATAAFYQKTLGLELKDGVLHAPGGAGLGLELVGVDDSAYAPTVWPKAGYQGLSARVPSVAAALEAATASGGSVLSEPEEVSMARATSPTRMRRSST